MTQQADLIFISYSKNRTEKVARTIYNLLKSIYTPASEAKVEIFLSTESLTGGRFSNQIIKNLNKARCGITVLSPENIHDSPWLMFEAGALSLAVEKNGGLLLPFLFNRHLDEVEAPLKELQLFRYYDNDEGNFEQLRRFFININESLTEQNRISDTLKLESYLHKYWNVTLKCFNETSNEMRDSAVSHSRSKTTNTASNDIISLETSRANWFQTESQGVVSLINSSIAAKTPRELETMFAKILEMRIDPSWLKQNHEEKQFGLHRVIVDKTRFSNFVVFTDGNRAILFDRIKDLENTSVQNDRYDVFGAVAFENKSLNRKIKSDAFLDAPIQKIEPIEGAAIEYNRKNADSQSETVVMFGVCVTLSEDDLSLAVQNTLNDEIQIFDLITINSLKNKLTSKAVLGLDYLISKRIPKS